ncbi:hypothetical protein PsorP6_002503 [Peronosclerospora sorghi]|uniref:Uncharacterized protein n=1 Tax=Peronosclerospora sorghi TaxID=230839 RepID=A0ACC0WYF5_9STRA|nr:hypothetical protein PsorP6_002503 [Peronosclerospora sorghi]
MVDYSSSARLTHRGHNGLHADNALVLEMLTRLKIQYIKMEIVQCCWELVVSSITGSRVLDELIDGLKHIVVEMGAPVSDEIVRKALQYLQNKQPFFSNLAKLSTERIAKLKVCEIKHHLEAEKPQIEARDAVLAKEFKSPVDRARNGMNSRFFTILILHHELQQLPWEGLDIMTQCRGVTRMPSRSHSRECQALSINSSRSTAVSAKSCGRSDINSASIESDLGTRDKNIRLGRNHRPSPRC